MRSSGGMLVLVLLGGVAQAQTPPAAAEQAAQPGAPMPTPTPMPPRAEIEVLGEAAAAGRYSEALRLAEAYTAGHPDDAQGFYYLGALRLQTLELDAALKALDRCVELEPAATDCHSNRASVLHARGDVAGARAAVQRALALAPADELALGTLRDLEVDARITAGTPPALGVGTVAAFVDATLRELATRGASALRERVDLIRFPIEVRNDFARLLKELETAWDSQMTQRGNKYLGFEVSPTVIPGANNEATVEVWILVERSLTHEQVNTIREWMERPELKQLLDEQLRALLDGLDKDDRNAFLQRARGVKQRLVFPVSVEVVGATAEAYRIRDMLIGPVRFSQAMRPMMEHTRGPRSRSPYEMGKLVGYGLGVLLLGALLVRRLRG